MTTGEMAILDGSGDTKIIWNSDNEDEVENAKRTFYNLVKEKKYLAFSVDKKGEKGEQVKTFDPDMEKLILVPPMKGG
jgi:hypothetical protein